MLCLRSHIPWVVEVVVIRTKSYLTWKSVTLSHSSPNPEVLRRGGALCRGKFQRDHSIFLGWPHHKGSLFNIIWDKKTCSYTTLRLLSLQCTGLWENLQKCPLGTWQAFHPHIPISAMVPMGRQCLNIHTWQSLGRALLNTSVLHLPSVVYSIWILLPAIGRNSRYYVTSFLVATVMEVSDDDSLQRHI